VSDKIHVSEEVRLTLSTLPRLKTLENFCPKAKSILVKLQTKNYRDLDKALEEAFKAVSKKDTRNCCNHYCHYTSSVRGECGRNYSNPDT